MNSEQLTQILKKLSLKQKWQWSGQAGKFDLRIVDDQFDGKRTDARQQAVYAPWIPILRVVQFTLLPFVQWQKTNGAKQAFRSLNING